MSAPKGNRFWEARSSHGRKPIFANPDELWTACVEYFKWNEDNPLFETKSYMFQGAPVQDQIPKMRAMTLMGLCLFLDISQDAWRNYRQQEDFIEVTTRAEEIIRKQKFEGAAADQLNANIIARDLGLADKSELTGANGGPIEYANMTDEELDRRLQALNAVATTKD
jgi:hypothetical protein